MLRKFIETIRDYQENTADGFEILKTTLGWSLPMQFDLALR